MDTESITTNKHLGLDYSDVIKKTLTFLAAMAAIALIATPTVASAVSPTADAYSGIAGQQQTGGGGGTPSSPEPSGDVASNVVSSPSSDAGSLPFTGFELTVALIVGAGLLGAGLLLRRTLRDPGTPA